MSKVVVLYQISNAKGEDGTYNAFELPRTNGPVTLSDIKNNCQALIRLNVAGSHGYHWRVRVDDKQHDPKGPIRYSWWDIQDENARLPVKEVTASELGRMLTPPVALNSSQEESKGGGGVMGSLGKAMNKVAMSVESSSQPNHDHGPRVPIVIFKLLDTTKLYDNVSGTQSSVSQYAPRPRRISSRTNVPMTQTGAPPRPSQPPQQRASAPQHQNRPHQQVQPTSVTQSRAPVPAPSPSRAPSSTPRVQEGTLMDFGSAPAPPTTASRSLHRSDTSTSATGRAPNETRAQQLKREYEEKKKKENRVWDDVDQRWVTVDPSVGASSQRSSTSAPPGADVEVNRSTLKGVSLENVSVAGKSREVAQAIQERVSDMKNAQQKALDEIREREEAKKKAENEEDVVRQKLEPRIKEWSEEHGKKKQLRALLANLHTILWPDANWKPMGLGDLLDDKKVKLAFHKASRVVHPDKTMSLGPEERFLAKRIFDALSQAKSELDK